MKNEQAQRIIAEHFSKKVRKDPKIRNAYLLVHSDKLGVHLNIAEGSADHAVNANQPYYCKYRQALYIGSDRHSR